MIFKNSFKGPSCSIQVLRKQTPGLGGQENGFPFLGSLKSSNSGSQGQGFPEQSGDLPLCILPEVIT